MIDTDELDCELAVINGDMRESVFPVVKELKSAHAGSCQACRREFCSSGTRGDLMNRIALKEFLVTSSLPEEDFLIHYAFIGLEQVLSR